jgi:TPR repeat protein
MDLTRKVKVLQIGGNIQKNGITTFLLSTYRRLCADFSFVFINTAYRVADREVATEIIKIGGKIYHLPCMSVAEIEDELKEIIKKEQPDVFHSHYFYSGGDYMRIAFECGIPVRISHCHNDKSKFLTAEEWAEVKQSRELIEKYATVKLAVSNEAGRFLFGDNTFSIRHAAIETSAFYPIKDKREICRDFGLSDKIKYSLFVGRFTPQKNVGFFVELFKALPLNRKLIMVGEGEEKSGFIEKITAAGIADRFIFVNDRNLNALYNIADTFLLPSLFEGANLALVEAQAAGTPCIASDSLTRESDLGGVTFLLLKTELWVKAITNTNDLPQIKSVDATAFDADKVAKELFAIYSLDGNLSDEYIRLAKEYMLGSELRFADRKKVVEALRKAHELGNIRGSFYYALQYFEGSGIDRNITLAEEIVSNILADIKAEAEKEKSEFIVILADICSFGLGIPQDFNEALRYYLQAAALGNAEAMCNLGYMYSVGQGIGKDLECSFEWYLKSAKLGYLHSMRDIGVCYYQGLGTKQDYKQAIKWLRTASKQNYSHATCDLALCYLTGCGIKKDLTKAADCYLLAIKQDRARAIRDVIANNINVNELLINGRIEFIVRDRIDNIDDNVLVDNTVVVNKDIKDIDPSVFYSHSQITKFFVEKENECYKAQGGVLFSKDGKMLVRFPLGSSLVEYSVPTYVEHIGKHAFQNCRMLQKVALHDGITSIGDSAFDDCKALGMIKLPPNLKRIGAWAFHGCDKIETVFIPKAVEKIGLYAFGSCESLRDIVADEESTIVKTIGGNLYSQDGCEILQYAIGKKERIFALPAAVTKISFRAFSDAFNLEYIDARSVVEASEKAFYYCTKLKEVKLNSACKTNGENVFGCAANGFKATYGRYGRTFLVADIHGYLRLDFLVKKVAEFVPIEDDVIVILGDAGIVWQDEMNEDVRKFYSSLSYDVLFLDGNHENFDLLNKLPIVERYGDAVHEVLPNVFHLIRGNAYLINGKKFFVFGGGYSVKRETNSSPVTTWDDELPSAEEFKRGLKTLAENENRFDYVLTHQAPQSLLETIKHSCSQAEAELVGYLERVRNTTKFARWFFGHLHKDITVGNIVGLYESVEVIE